MPRQTAALFCTLLMAMLTSAMLVGTTGALLA